jgi:hypothetical protein
MYQNWIKHSAKGCYKNKLKILINVIKCPMIPSIEKIVSNNSELCKDAIALNFG